MIFPSDANDELENQLRRDARRDLPAPPPDLAVRIRAAVSGSRPETRLHPFSFFHGTIAVGFAATIAVAVWWTGASVHRDDAGDSRQIVAGLAQAPDALTRGLAAEFATLASRDPLRTERLALHHDVAMLAKYLTANFALSPKPAGAK